MSGLERATARLFDASGTLFVLALDHPQTFGPMPGLESAEAAIRRCDCPGIDGFILNVGAAGLVANPPYIRKKLVLRTSLGGSALAGAFPDVHRNVVSPRTAVAAGADAVLMMLVLGGEDSRSMQQVAADIDAFHDQGLPCIVEILADDFSRTNDTVVQETGARIAAEVGADVVKVFFTPDFRKVIAGCPVPALLAGGPKGGDILEVARAAVDSGARGFAFGRNVFQHPDPQALVASLDSILRGGRG